MAPVDSVGEFGRRQFLARLAAVAAAGLSWQLMPSAARAATGTQLLARRQVTYQRLIEALAQIPGSPIPAGNISQAAAEAASALSAVYGVADARFQVNVDAFLDAAVGKTDFSPTTDQDVARFEAKSPRGRRDELRRALRSPDNLVLRPGRTPEQPILGSFSQATLARQAVSLALTPFVDREFASSQADQPVLAFLLDKEG
jgi:hypothetical protein